MKFRYPNDNYGYHPKSFWHDELGDLSSNAILVIFFSVVIGLAVPFFTWLHFHSIDQDIARADLGSSTNPCLEFHSNNRVVIENYESSPCDDVIRYYLDELHYKPVTSVAESHLELVK